MIYALRMMGLYMILPVLSLFALSLKGATPVLIGFALGAYGLTQAIFQIPLGHLSDRIGRKGVISIGLGLFAAGSLLAAFGQHIVWLIAGRILQGSGAVASSVVALAADLSPDHARTQAMARLGLWVGVSLALGVVAGPVLASTFGVPALFIGTAILSSIAIVYLQFLVPEPVHISSPAKQDRLNKPSSSVKGLGPEEFLSGKKGQLHMIDLKAVLTQPTLFLLCAGIFLLHATLTVIFVIMPIQLAAHVGQGMLSLILAPTIAAGLALMVMSARMADRHRRRRVIFLYGALLFIASCGVMTAMPGTFIGLTVGLGLFILSLSLLEPLLPALMSRQAPRQHRGTAIGVFHMCQFFGSFAGGPVGGAFIHSRGSILFLILGLLGIIWSAVVLRSREGFFHGID